LVMRPILGLGPIQPDRSHPISGEHLVCLFVDCSWGSNGFYPCYLCIKRRGIYFAMLTLAFAQLLYFVGFQWVNLTGGDNGLRTSPLFLSLYSDFPSTSTHLCAFTFSFSCLSLYRFGDQSYLTIAFRHVLQAVRENDQRAKSCGYETSNVRWLAFVISGAISGLAGGLYALYLHFVGIESLYWTTSGQVVMMTLLGGMGTFIGPFIGPGFFST